MHTFRFSLHVEHMIEIVNDAVAIDAIGNSITITMDTPQNAL